LGDIEEKKKFRKWLIDLIDEALEEEEDNEEEEDEEE
jgi:hypothetical protein